MKEISKSKKVKMTLVFTLAFMLMLSIGVISALAEMGDDNHAGSALTDVVMLTDDITDAFRCDNFRAVVREQLSLSDSDPILISEVAGVTQLLADNRNITSLDGIEYFTALTSLGVWNNQLTTLDLSGNPMLEVLGVSQNRLTSLDVSANPRLRNLMAWQNQLTELNVGNNPALEDLGVQENQLTAINVSSSPLLVYLDVSGNNLTALDVRNNTRLEQLWVSSNRLASLDVSQNTVLEILTVSGNHLTSLDVSRNTELWFLLVTNNNIPSPDMVSGVGNTRLPAINSGSKYTLGGPGFWFTPQDLPVTTLRTEASVFYGAQIPANSIVIDPVAAAGLGLTSVTVSAGDLSELGLDAAGVNLFHISTAGVVTPRPDLLDRNEDGSVTVRFSTASIFVLSATAPTGVNGGGGIVDTWYAGPQAAPAPTAAHNVPQTGITGRMVLPMILGLFGVALITGSQIIRKHNKKAEK